MLKIAFLLATISLLGCNTDEKLKGTNQSYRLKQSSTQKQTQTDQTTPSQAPQLQKNQSNQNYDDISGEGENHENQQKFIVTSDITTNTISITSSVHMLWVIDNSGSGGQMIIDVVAKVTDFIDTLKNTNREVLITALTCTDVETYGCFHMPNIVHTVASSRPNVSCGTQVPSSPCALYSLPNAQPYHYTSEYFFKKNKRAYGSWFQLYSLAAYLIPSITSNTLNRAQITQNILDGYNFFIPYDDNVPSRFNLPTYMPKNSHERLYNQPLRYISDHPNSKFFRDPDALKVFVIITDDGEWGGIKVANSFIDFLKDNYGDLSKFRAFGFTNTDAHVGSVLSNPAKPYLHVINKLGGRNLLMPDVQSSSAPVKFFDELTETITEASETVSSSFALKHPDRTIIKVLVNGTKLSSDQYQVIDGKLVISSTLQKNDIVIVYH